MFNGELKKYKLANERVEHFENKPDVQAYLAALKSREVAEKAIKEVANAEVKANPEKYTDKENQTLYNKDGLIIKAWPSFSTSFDLANVTAQQFTKLHSLNVLTIDQKVFESHVDAGRIDESLKNTVSRKVFKNSSCSIKSE